MIRLNTWVNCTELSRVAGRGFSFRATWQVTSQTAVICACGHQPWMFAYTTLEKRREHVWEKRKLTFTLRSPHPRAPLALSRLQDIGQLLGQQLSSVVQTPVDNVAIQKCSVWFFFFLLLSFHIVVGKRQHVPTDGLLVMALHQIVRGHSASIAQILSNN